MSKLIINNSDRDHMNFEFEGKYYQIPSTMGHGANPELVGNFKNLGFELYSSTTWPNTSRDLLLVVKDNNHNITEIQHKAGYQDDINIYCADADFYRQQLSDKDQDLNVIKFDNIQPHYISKEMCHAILKI